MHFGARPFDARTGLSFNTWYHARTVHSPVCAGEGGRQGSARQRGKQNRGKWARWAVRRGRLRGRAPSYARLFFNEWTSGHASHRESNRGGEAASGCQQRRTRTDGRTDERAQERRTCAARGGGRVDRDDDDDGRERERKVKRNGGRGRRTTEGPRRAAFDADADDNDVGRRAERARER